jgi:hypothetical protein
MVDWIPLVGSTIAGHPAVGGETSAVPETDKGIPTRSGTTLRPAPCGAVIRLAAGTGDPYDAPRFSRDAHATRWRTTL